MAGCSIVPTLGPPTDIGAIWDRALARYEATASTKIQTHVRLKNTDDLLSNVSQKETAFVSRRHSGTRSDKFRILLKNSLAPIEQWADIVTNATKTVRYLNLFIHSTDQSS